jgi:protein tyrosine/serine phosphatase
MADPANSPVYIHCAGAGRAGAMMMIKRILVDGWTTEKALAEAEAIGMNRGTLKDFVIEYVKAHRKTG